MSNICSNCILTRTNVFDKLVTGSGDNMQKVLKKYGVIIIFYLVVILGVLVLSSRLRYLSHQNQNNNLEVVAITK